MHDRIISLIRKVWAHTTSWTSSRFIELSVPSQESERSCICVVEVSILPLSASLHLDFGTVPTVCYFWGFFCILWHQKRFVFTLFIYYLIYLHTGQTKNYTIGICCSFAKHAALRRKSKDWSSRNQNNVFN